MMDHYEPTLFLIQKINTRNVSDATTDLKTNSEKIQLQYSTQPASSLEIETGEFLHACFLAFIARITCESTIHVGLLTENGVFTNEEKEGLHTQIKPCIFKIDNEATIDNVIKSCCLDIKQAVESRRMPDTMTQDNRSKQAQLHHNIVIQHGNVHGTKGIDNVLSRCNIYIIFHRKKNPVMEVLYRDEGKGQTFSTLMVIEVLKHFKTFLCAINTLGNSQILKSIGLISKEEQDRFYKITSQEIAAAGQKETVYELIDRQCEICSLRIAVQTSSNQLTYGGLRREIDNFRKLIQDVFRQKRGHTKQLVAVHMPNSVSYIITILALARCRLPFLPLPTDWPTERIMFSLKDSSTSSAVISKDTLRKGNLKKLMSFMKVKAEYQIQTETVILVDFEEATNPESSVLDDSALYVMYTSGSTGNPKGVKVKESGVINMTKAQITSWNIVPGDVIAQFASIGFDASISEIFTALCSGATIAVLNESERHGRDFVTSMNQMKVSVVTFPASVLNIYSPKDLPSLRKVVAAGEICTLQLAKKWTANGNISFYNAYGPTECTVCATIYIYHPDSVTEDVNHGLPIGEPINNVEVFLFDSFMNPVPPGVVGELFIGGICASNGYIGHAEHLTETTFIQNPLTKCRCILYKSGDLAFRDTDGNFNYIGRTDGQVKIRGCRINLGEIEQVLMQHSEVESAVVVVHKCSRNCNESIAAYLSPKEVDVSRLRKYLYEILPTYMVPTFMKTIEVKELPTTTNLKIDRRKLECDESVHEQDFANSDGILDGTQQIIAKYWFSIFGLDKIFLSTLQRKSSFSKLGGSSLHLVLFLRQLEEEVGGSLSYAEFATLDTIEEFATALQQSRSQTRIGHSGYLKDGSELRQLILNDTDISDILRQSRHSAHFLRDITDDSYVSTKIKHCQRERYNPLELPVSQNSEKEKTLRLLISGVTGFLGAFLLSEILEQSNFFVNCMVRDTTETKGMKKIIANLATYGLWKPQYSSRVSVVLTELSAKRLRIKPEMYDSLCNDIDIIFMNAAYMNFNKAYENHKPVNVESVREFIILATTGKQKYLFFTSSLSVFLFPPVGTTSDRRTVYLEQDFLTDPMYLECGYGQSKWAGEHLVKQALEILPGGAIFRPARISGRTIDGVGPKDDLFARTVRGIKQLGSYPDIDFPYDLVPVDFCARAMVEIALQICKSKSGRYEKVYHLYNRDTIPFKNLFTGMGLAALPLVDWRKNLRNVDRTNKDLIPLIPFFLSHFWDRASDWPLFDTTNVDNTISDGTKLLLRPASELWKIYKQYFGI